MWWSIVQGLTLLVGLIGEDDGREGHCLSNYSEKVAFPSRTDLTEGH